MHLAAIAAAGALVAAALGVPAWVDDVKEDGGPPAWVTDVKEQGGPPSFVGDLRNEGNGVEGSDEAEGTVEAAASENAATPAEGPPAWVAEVKQDGGPPAWVAEVKEDGGPPAWVADHRATPSAKSSR